MDILLTHGYFLNDDETERRIMKPYPPLGILYISSYLKSKGFHVEIFDSTFKSKRDFYSYVNEKVPSIVGVYVNLMTKLNALELIGHCKRQGATVIVGGPDVREYAEAYITHGADVAVVGEGEATLEELIPHLQLRGPTNMQRIAGILYRETDGTFVRTPARALLHDLDSLPLPDRDAVGIQQYIDTWRTHHGRGSISLICARGCPFTCTWCSRSVFGETHRRRSPKHVVDEIEMLIARYKPDQLWFADDVFTIHHKWFHEFYDEMKRRSLRIPFECISRADRLNEDILKKMADLGAYRIWYGSESGSQRILDAMDRRVSVEQIRTITALAQRYGIEAGLFVMLGYPGEEIRDIDLTIEHLKTTRPDTFLTTLAYPIKGTTFYDDVKSQLISTDNWETVSDRTVTFHGRHSERFYWFATRHMVNEVRYHKLATNGRGNLLPLAASFTKSKLARWGMFMLRKART